MNNSILAKSSASYVYITMIVDSDALIKAFPNPSQLQLNPTLVNDTKYFYFVATDANTITGTGTGDLVIKATVGDGIRWTGVSETNNFDNSVMVYGIVHFSGDKILKTPSFTAYTKGSAVPHDDETPFPAIINDQYFWFMESTIKSKGSEKYLIRFAIYNRPQNGNQTLFGYFQWDPSVTVTH